ncbi:glycosyltransferase [Qipengyuania sp. RANM35]|uniref:glycosyltransferase n=1 Tax=Qipengyuania sp. RANM35 TaxID=3068635 RepID=UPI0034DAC78F
MSDRILLDVTRAVSRRWRGKTPSGLDRVADAYAKHFAAKSLAVLQVRGRPFVLDAGNSERLLGALDQPRPEFRKVVMRMMGRLPIGTAPAADLAGARYLNVSHTDFDLAAHWRWVRRHSLRPTYFLHDLIPISSPEVTTPHKTARHRGRVMRALSGAEGIVVNSHTTAQELTLFARKTGSRLAATLVAPLAAERRPVTCGQPQTTGPVFVSIGTVEKRKNYMLLLDVWSRLVRRLGVGTPKLVIVGSWGLGGHAVRNRLMRDAELARFVEVRSGLGDAEVARLVSSARAVLLPSLAEGFGLPLIEALQQGVPVIASDLPSFIEFGQGIPTLIDPANAIAWEQAIVDFCGESIERERQLACVGNFTSPTWADHFASVEGWLASAARTEPCARREYGIYTSDRRSGEQGREVQC